MINLKVIRMLECLHEETLQIQRLNYAYVVLMPKKRAGKK